MNEQQEYYQSWLSQVHSQPGLKDSTKPKLNEWIPITLTEKQEAFLWLEDLDAFYGGAAGGGKSYALLAAALQYVDCPGYNAIIIRDTLANLEKPDSIIDLSFKWLVNTDAAWNGNKKRWSFTSGATLSFGYLDTPKDHFQYQSAQYQYVGIDEVVNIRKNQAEFMFSRMRKTKGSPVPIRFRCASNPPLPEQIERGAWVKQKYVDEKTREKGVIFIPAALDDNPYLDAEEYEKSLDKLDPITKAKMKDGDWEIEAMGNMFNVAWFEIVDIAPAEGRTLRYWDMAGTKKTEQNNPAYTAGTKIVQDVAGVYYIADIKRDRLDPADGDRFVKQTAALDGPNVEIIMEQEPGSAGKRVIDYYRRLILPQYVFDGDKVTGSKVERARPFASQAKAGNIKLVKGEWIKDFLYEAMLFPNGEFKDQVDSAAGAFTNLSTSGFFRSRNT